ncbi:MAG: hypothetical protein V7637_1566, partial [Mycobacteriales bacterium]
MVAAVRVVLAVSLALLASGCLRFRGDLTVRADDTVSGTIIVAVQSIASTGQPVIDKLPAEFTDKVKAEPYNQDGFIGSTLTVTRLPFDQVGDLLAAIGPAAAPSLAGLGGLGDIPGLPTTEPDPSGSSSGSGVAATTDIALRRDGNKVQVTGRFFFPALTFGADPTGSFDARLTLTFPGAVTETNGQRDGRSVTWVFQLGQEQPVQATAYLQGGPGAAGGARYALLGSGVLVAVVAALFLALRRRRLAPAGGPGPNELFDGGPVLPAGPAPAPTQVAAPGSDSAAWARPPTVSMRYTRQPVDATTAAPPPDVMPSPARAALPAAAASPPGTASPAALPAGPAAPPRPAATVGPASAQHSAPTGAAGPETDRPTTASPTVPRPTGATPVPSRPGSGTRTPAGQPAAMPTSRPAGPRPTGPSETPRPRAASAPGTASAEPRRPEPAGSSGSGPAGRSPAGRPAAAAPGSAADGRPLAGPDRPDVTAGRPAATEAASPAAPEAASVRPVPGVRRPPAGRPAPGLSRPEPGSAGAGRPPVGRPVAPLPSGVQRPPAASPARPEAASPYRPEQPPGAGRQATDRPAADRPAAAASPGAGRQAADRPAVGRPAAPASPGAGPQSTDGPRPPTAPVARRPEPLRGGQRDGGQPGGTEPGSVRPPYERRPEVADAVPPRRRPEGPLSDPVGQALRAGAAEYEDAEPP